MRCSSERAQAAADNDLDTGPLADEVDALFAAGEPAGVRIIAGSRKGHGIAAPPGLTTRPTSDRVRENVFNIVAPWVGGAHVLDLFAGSGAMGLEALSRGAARAVFVEADTRACRTINENLDKLRLTGAQVLCQDVDPVPGQRVAYVRPRLLRSAVRGARAVPARPRPPRAGSARRGRAARARDSVARPRAGAAAGDEDVPPLRRRAHYALRAPVLTAIYPGTYDPVTNGHVDVITRAAAIFDRIVVGVVRDPHHKETMFTVEERVEFLRDALRQLDNVEVDVFSELVVDFARRWGAKTIVKGLRVISDFEWEFQMNHLNRTLAPEIETVYVMASPQYSFVSSSGVKEIASFGGRVDALVPEAVARRFVEMFPQARAGSPVSPQE